MSEKETVRDTINALYNAAGVNYKFRGEVTEQTAAVVGLIVLEIKSCTTALNWVPRPSGGKASISWVVRNVGQSFVRDLKKRKTSLTCARRALLSFKSELVLSGM